MKGPGTWRATIGLRVLAAAFILLLIVAGSACSSSKRNGEAIGGKDNGTNVQVREPAPGRSVDQAESGAPKETNGSDQQADIPPLVWEEAFAVDFDTPVALRHAGDGSGLVYVVEQPGRIQVLDAENDRPRKTLFLDLTDVVHDRGWEQGLLGLAFHPDYAGNGLFYVNYTTRNGTVIAEYRRSDADPLRADPASGRMLLTFDQPYENHNGGELAFGPDGYLYIATGDGGSGGDPRGNGQNLASWLGKILRIDVDGRDAGKPYAVPPDNPYVGDTDGALPEIYAYGLRNPWRFSFDPETGILWAADVGQNRKEEINRIEKGGNYGWNVMEGTDCFLDEDCDPAAFIPPVYEYEPTNRASVTGGYVYRGEGIPGLVGHYVFADFMDGRMWTLDADGGVTEARLHPGLQQPGITSFGTDEAGELYACLYDGRILRLAGKTD